jgi:hypothetical protein
MTTAAAATSERKNVGIRNLYVLLGSILATCAGIAYFLLTPRTPSGWLALALSVLCVWIFLLELRESRSRQTPCLLPTDRFGGCLLFVFGGANLP